MYDFGYQNDRLDAILAPEIPERRYGADRRKTPAPGFTYISTVGWICRRELLRRKDDPGFFPNREL